MVCHSLLQWVTFCQNSPLWPVHLQWPYRAWLIASSSFESQLAVTKQWSMKSCNTLTTWWGQLIHWKRPWCWEKMKVKLLSCVQLFATPRTDYSLPGSSVHGIFQARIVEWAAISRERLKAKGEEGNRGWDGWMASPIQWTWTWGNSGRWWGTGKPGLL